MHKDGLVEEVDPYRNNSVDADVGIHSSTIGSFMPQGIYRPMPMAWLVTAWALHSFVMIVLVSALSGKPVFFTLSTTIIVSAWIIHRAFSRGMKTARVAWKASLVIALGLNWLLAALTALALAGY